MPGGVRARAKIAGAIIYDADGAIIQPAYRQIKITGTIEIPADTTVPPQGAIVLISGRARIKGFKLDEDSDGMWFVEVGGKVVRGTFEEEQATLGPIAEALADTLEGMGEGIDSITLEHEGRSTTVHRREDPPEPV